MLSREWPQVAQTFESGTWPPPWGSEAAHMCARPLLVCHGSPILCPCGQAVGLILSLSHFSVASLILRATCPLSLSVIPPPPVVQLGGLGLRYRSRLGPGVVHSVVLDSGAMTGLPRGVLQISPTALEILSPPVRPRLCIVYSDPDACEHEHVSVVGWSCLP